MSSASASSPACITILVPVLNRPHRARPLVESLATTLRFVRVDVLFVLSLGDQAELAAVDEIVAARLVPTYAATCQWDPGPGDYARKINAGARWAVDTFGSEFVFLGADDLRFHPGWAERALACHLETHACVVGTNDGGNAGVMRGDHSTHTLVHRDYLECGTADEPDSGNLLHEGYSHSFSDTEFVRTAMARETWAHATDCLVEHEHPLWGKAPEDQTYQKGAADYATDQLLFHSRRYLWEAC